MERTDTQMVAFTRSGEGLSHKPKIIHVDNVRFKPGILALSSAMTKGEVSALFVTNIHQVFEGVTYWHQYRRTDGARHKAEGAQSW